MGGGQADGICTRNISLTLSSSDQGIDNAFSALYDHDRLGGLGGSSLKVARWLGDIRSYFPTSIVKVMQQDALQRLNLRQMLLEPEMLEVVEPDVHLAVLRQAKPSFCLYTGSIS